MPKVNREGRAQVLNPEELDEVMTLLAPKYRGVLSVCRYSACRISEALGLTWAACLPDHILLSKGIVKGKKKSREIPLHPRLAQELEKWKSAWGGTQGRSPNSSDYLFPSDHDEKRHITRQAVDHALRLACRKLGLHGVSTHSFRRSALTAASSKGVPLRHLQEISGHASLNMLARYLDVSEEQKRVAALAFG